MADYAFRTTQVTDVNITQMTDVNITQVIDVSDKRLYLSPLSAHMADYAFKTTQVSDVNITQVTDVSDRRLYICFSSICPHG